MLVRTRSDLKDATIIGNEASNQFIKKYCSFSTGELLFYGDETPSAFYAQMAQFFLKAHGHYTSSTIHNKIWRTFVRTFNQRV